MHPTIISAIITTLGIITPRIIANELDPLSVGLFTSGFTLV